MTLTREQIAGLRDSLRRQQYNTIAVQRDDLDALLDIAEAVANAPVTRLWESGQDTLETEPLPADAYASLIGQRVAVLPLAGEVAK